MILNTLSYANQATLTWVTFKMECYRFYLKSNEICGYMPTHLEEATRRILRASPIMILDEFDRFDKYIQNIRLDVTVGICRRFVLALCAGTLIFYYLIIYLSIAYFYLTAAILPFYYLF